MFGLNTQFPGVKTYNRPTDAQWQAMGQVGAAALNSAPQHGANLANSFGAMAGAAANMYAPYAGALGQMGGNVAQMFDSYGRNAGNVFNAIGNIGANALTNQANQNQNLHNAYAQGANSYLNFLGNMGAAGLAGYGQAANSAMQAQAMNSTAALKAMADAITANQTATAAYGGSRNQALGALAAARSNAGTGMANARAANSNAAAQLGGLGSAALANNSSAGANALANLGVSMKDAASNDLNYTRDMAKLGLARELGLTGANVASAGMSAISQPSGGVSISSPDGMIAGGGFRPATMGGAMPSARYVDPYANRQWYQDRQTSDGAGLRSLGNLQGDIVGRTDRGEGSILDALAASSREIGRAGLGIDSDAGATYAGMDDTQADIMRGDVLAQLGSGYDSGMGTLRDAFQRGQQDPRSIFDQVRRDIEGLSAPYLPAGRGAMDDFYGNFPPAIPGFGGGPGQLNPYPYLDAIRTMYTPYMSALDGAFNASTGNLMGLANRAGQGYSTGLNSLQGNFNRTAGSIENMFNKSSGKVIGDMLLRPTEQFGEQVNLRRAMEREKQRQAELPKNMRSLQRMVW